MEPQKYKRKPFYVEAVQVTEENMEEVAEWCRGKVVQAEPPRNPYVRVNVYRPLSRRQTQAFNGDRVVQIGKGFKVYTEDAFWKMFEEIEAKSSTMAFDPEAPAGEMGVVEEENDPGAQKLLKEIFEKEEETDDGN